jgi:MoaA/NifB/PqqE/SkfB family radical SAM enzyme
MQANESAKPLGSVPPQRLFKRQVPEEAPVTSDSAVLFRFGEQCNNHCSMCSNTGDASLFFHSTEELLRRAAVLQSCGFRRVVATGGEATIHPGFWTVIERVATYGMSWDINTHGRSFSKPRFAQRAVETGLQRAIVSLHSHHPATSAAIFGTNEDAHHETVAGIDHLLAAGVDVMLNCVLTRLNLTQLEDYLQAGYQRFGGKVAFKFVFPTTIGRGGQWPGIATLRYSDVRETVQRLWALAAQMHLRLFFESFPNCILQDPEAVNLGRSAFGETHYLDDATGDRVYAMRHIEAELSAFGEACQQCAAVRSCSGVALEYAQQHGVGELTPFLPQRARTLTGQPTTDSQTTDSNPRRC